MTPRLSKRRVLLGLRLVKENPAFVGRAAVRLANRLYHRRGYTAGFYEQGLDVFDEDWDNLILLDACRREMLEQHPFDGEYDTAISRGSDTFEYLQANCGSADQRDTVYVSASPVLQWHSDTIEQNFHDVIFVWEERGWNEQHKTVMPEDVRDLALEAADEYPNKRLFIHFLQPHYPFIDADTDWDKRQLHDPDDATPSFWRSIEVGELDVSPAHLWELYEGNVETVLPYAEELVDRLDGKSVVTSDHGNMFGERSKPIPMREWGHPPGTYTSELVTVPWIECEANVRRDVARGVRDDEPAIPTERDEEVRQQMVDLGYLE